MTHTLTTKKKFCRRAHPSVARETHLAKVSSEKMPREEAGGCLLGVLLSFCKLPINDTALGEGRCVSLARCNISDAARGRYRLRGREKNKKKCPVRCASLEFALFIDRSNKAEDKQAPGPRSQMRAL